jgi:hypothetical protein
MAITIFMRRYPLFLCRTGVVRTVPGAVEPPAGLSEPGTLCRRPKTPALGPYRVKKRAKSLHRHENDRIPPFPAKPPVPPA